MLVTWGSVLGSRFRFSIFVAYIGILNLNHNSISRSGGSAKKKWNANDTDDPIETGWADYRFI